jgi:4-hydroxy 2-oxovalerate aldolase
MSKQHIHIVDTTLRDGSHAVSHSYSPEQVRAVVSKLDAAGTEIIEISHGDGLTGSTYNYGFSKYPEEELLRAGVESAKHAKIGILLIPGIGTVADLRRAEAQGVRVARIATHITEADISRQHIEAAKSLGLFTVGFLMMAHMGSPAKAAEQAKLMEQYGADYINLADSAGYLLPDGVAERIRAVRSAVSIPVGFHAHNNLSFAVANSLAAAHEGAEYLDATLRGIGAGAGNAQFEVLTAVLQREGYDTGLDMYAIMDAAEKTLEAIMQRPQIIRTASLMLGYAGVYSSFLLHVYRVAEKFSLEPRDILVELGKRGMVGGQEDMIVNVAYELSHTAL